ncbi:ABC transporter permease subunit [Clostridium tyrobutyricum]|uniref:ABC transporter permease n=2 Tax=Clostridium tyrobutyricum TaxID=1519 RepID=UPI00164D01BD|nr:ABC transporter permease [Clostridium tyrobutyricum]MBV4419435.1 ABC transporter permease subunit [Clostridium tyrobutyricum]MBV4425011.1 ABC transporter permease subunit [Clostridium tyrobutyricum]MBV4437018.1 ABC transporter permease subunit [Clostridium tyrobutyricum]
MTVIGVLKRVAFYIILIIIWEMVYKLNVDIFKIWKPYTFPSPIAVAKTLITLISNNTLGIAIVVSLRRLVIGYFISLVIGVAIGLLIVKYKYIDENFSSLILGMQTLPSLCWLPFAILWCGLNEKAILFVITIGSTFAIAIATESGIKNVNPLYMKAARTMGAKGWKLYLNVVIPAAMPAVITGMKQGWSFAWRALMSGEMLSATQGLGQVLMVGRNIADISQVMAVMIVILILGLLFDKFIFEKLEKNVRYKCGLDRRS